MCGPSSTSWTGCSGGARPAAKAWFLQWLAYSPEPAAEAVPGRPNLGRGRFRKGFIGDIMRDLYDATMLAASPRRSFTETSTVGLEQPVDPGRGSHGSDKRAHADNLKGLITRRRSRSTRTTLPTITLPDPRQLLPDLEPPERLVHGRQGPAVLHPPRAEKASEEFYVRVDAWRKAGGAAALFHYLLPEVDLAGFNPKGPAYLTQAKEEMIPDTRSHAERWISDLRDDPTTLLLLSGNTKAAQECDLWTPAQLFDAFNPDSDCKRGTEHGFYMTLRDAGFYRANKGRKIKTRNAGAQGFVIVRNADKWVGAKPTDCAAHWDACWSPRY